MTDTESRLREAMRTATSHSPEPVAFDLISRRVRTRRRRQTLIAAGTLVAVVVTTPVLIAQAGDGDRSGQPSRTGQPTRPVDPTPTTPSDTSELDPAVVQEPWSAKRWQQLPWSATGLPKMLDPAKAGTTSLDTDPVGYALAAVQDGNRGPVHLLGEDGRWRKQDLVGVEPTKDPDGYRGRPLGAGSLSGDGTRLALPQPHGLIVIDLATNKVRRHDLPGLPQRASWTPDGSEVLVWSTPDDSDREDSVLVDAGTGAWRQAPYDAYFTSYAEDGTAVEARKTGSSPFAYELRRFDSDGGMESVPLAVDLFEDAQTVTAAGTDAVIVMRDVVHASVPRQAGSWPGPTVVGIDSGQALAQMPMRGSEAAKIASGPLGWADDDTALLRLRDQVVAWDYKSGALRRVTEVANAGGGFGPGVSIATADIEAGD